MKSFYIVINIKRIKRIILHIMKSFLIKKRIYKLLYLINNFIKNIIKRKFIISYYFFLIRNIIY